jgi:rRNA maturation endonuclease Nob1
VALVAVLALRVGLQLALLHEAHDEILSDEPLLCQYCGTVVPDMAFCPACGAATRASSRSSRKARRDTRPVRTDAGPAEAEQ